MTMQRNLVNCKHTEEASQYHYWWRYHWYYTVSDHDL